MDITDLFHALDVDHNNVVDKDELKTGLKKLGVNFSEAKIDEMFRIADRDGNGTIDLGEFSKFFSHLPRLVRNAQPRSETAGPDPDAADGFFNAASDSVAALRHIFTDFDVDGSSTIEMEELRQGFKRVGLKISDQALQQLFTLADKDHNGTIDFVEFSTFFYHLPTELQRVKERQASTDGTQSDLHKLFVQLDGADSGLVNLDSLKSGFTRLGLHIPEKKIETMFALADKDGNGKIDFNEFSAFFYHLPALLKFAKLHPHP